LSDLKLSDTLQVALNLVVDSQLLLVQDGLLIEKVIVLTVKLRFGLLPLDELDLVLDPVLLDRCGLLLDFLDLLLEVLNLVLKRTVVLVTISTATQLSLLSVEMVDLEGLLLDLMKSILDVLLDSGNSLLLFLELLNEISELLVEDIVLCLSVEVIKSYS